MFLKSKIYTIVILLVFTYQKDYANTVETIQKKLLTNTNIFLNTINKTKTANYSKFQTEENSIKSVQFFDHQKDDSLTYLTYKLKNLHRDILIVLSLKDNVIVDYNWRFSEKRFNIKNFSKLELLENLKHIFMNGLNIKPFLIENININRQSIDKLVKVYNNISSKTISHFLLLNEFSYTDNQGSYFKLVYVIKGGDKYHFISIKYTMQTDMKVSIDYFNIYDSIKTLLYDTYKQKKYVPSQTKDIQVNSSKFVKLYKSKKIKALNNLLNEHSTTKNDLPTTLQGLKKIISVEHKEFSFNQFKLIEYRIDHQYHLIHFWILYNSENKIIHFEVQKERKINYKLISKRAARSDLLVLKDLLYYNFPSTDKTRDRINEKFMALNNSVKDNINTFQLVNLIKSQLSKLTIGEHCSCQLDLNFYGKIAFPYDLKIFDNKFYLNEVNCSINNKSKILQIEQPVDTLLNRLKEKSYTNFDIESNFWLYYVLEYGVPQSYSIEYIEDKDSLQKSISITPISLLEKVKNDLIKSNNKSVSLQSLNNNNYCLKIHSFEKKYNKELSNMLLRLAQQSVNNLIIDLRDNSGGSPFCMNTLLSAITKSNYEFSIKNSRKNFEMKHKNLIKKINNQTFESISKLDEWFEKLSLKCKKNDDSYNFEIKIKKDKDIPELKFKQLYLLVNKKVSSTALYFSFLFKHLNKGITIGNAPSSSIVNDYAGFVINYELPNSKLVYSLPLFKVNYSNENIQLIKENNLPIDQLVPDSLRLEYFLQGKDAELEEALKLIREKNEQ